MPTAYLSLILHAHLPYAPAPEPAPSLEETWLFEAITETYLPLLRLLECWQTDNIPHRLALSLSPPLVAMLQDERLQNRYLAHLAKLQTLAEQEMQRTAQDGDYHPLAVMYHELFADSRNRFENGYQGNLIAAFRRLQQQGGLELFTSAATHAFLPLLRTQPGAVRAQVMLAARQHAQTFDELAKGIWLPECGYYPGLEKILKTAGFQYFMVDSHALWQASPRPRYGVYAPVDCGNGLAAFARDPLSSQQVWSADIGYPGDADYREFYRDIGFDLPLDLLHPYLADGKTRAFTGIKYHRITGKTELKQVYRLQAAQRKVKTHVEHFLNLHRRRLQGMPEERPPLFVCPYDAELFGHWWFEGPQWLDALARSIHQQNGFFQLLSPSDYLRLYPDLQTAALSASSWGENGYSGFWLNRENDWIYPHLHHAAQRMESLARQYTVNPPDALIDRALRVACRVLLLAQASDLPFMLKNGVVAEHAKRRLHEYLGCFYYLDQAIQKGSLDERRIRVLEKLATLFPDLDYRLFFTPLLKTYEKP